MGDRRATRGLNPRVRVAVGAGPSQRERDDALARLLQSGDISIETIERIAELIGTRIRRDGRINHRWLNAGPEPVPERSFQFGVALRPSPTLALVRHDHDRLALETGRQQLQLLTPDRRFAQANNVTTPIRS